MYLFGSVLILTLIKSSETLINARFSPQKLQMNMLNSSEIACTISINATALPPEAQFIEVEFDPRTLSPQLDILELHDRLTIDLTKIKNNNYVLNHTLNLTAAYIGHATIELKSYLLTDGKQSSALLIEHNRPEITIVKNEGILDKIFLYSLIVFITISYINLGAQIDTENVRKLIETPRVILIGFLVGITVMPMASWFTGHVFFQDQPMYRIGSFIYACGPAASASVLWTVMFDSDKELSLGLQIASTVGALVTMPIFLYAMDRSIDLERQYTIKVPYMNLCRTLAVLLIALLIGTRLVGGSKRAKQISQRIFRPLTMFVLLFIITFSSITYWYVYRMFNWTITLMALIVTTTTYILSGLLGYMIHRDIDHMITISISSTYRNSGVAFATLVVAFQPPDIFIAYVPCLTQVVATSLIGLVLYSIKSLKKYYCNDSKKISSDQLEI